MELSFEEKKIDFNISNISSILDIVKDYPTDYVILNSNLNLNASLNYSLNNFEPIIYIDISDNCSVFSWDIKLPQHECYGFLTKVSYDTSTRLTGKFLPFFNKFIY